MFITAAKIAVVEGITSAFNAIGSASSNTTKDLVPRSITIEYPVEEIEWPAIYVQFRPTITQYTGLDPGSYDPVYNGNKIVSYNNIRHGYFEGSYDLQILAMSSEERDKIWETLINLFLMDTIAPSATALYESISANDLIAIALQKGSVIQVGDTVSPGTPWSPEELTYEATIRIRCIGEFFENKYSQTLLPISAVKVTGTLIKDEIAISETITVN